MNVKCEYCSKEFFKSPCYVKRTKHNFCGNNCYQQRKINRQFLNCLTCKKIVERVPSKIKSHIFCSNKCSAVFFNTQKNNIQRTGYCLWCQQTIVYPRQYCTDCVNQYSSSVKDKIPDLVKIYIRDFLSDKNKFSRIRINARHVLSDLKQICSICDYSTVIQCCHIIPISDFALEDFLGVVNHPSDLILLCPNHHIELDRGLLRIPISI